MDNKFLQNLSLHEITERCKQESGLYRRHQTSDTRYCLELFRRAIDKEMPAEETWSLIFSIYQGQLESWVKRHPIFPTCDEEVSYFVNRAIERFWYAMTPDKFSKAANNLGRILQYLKSCVHSAILDYQRAQTRLQLVTIEKTESMMVQDQQVGNALESEEFWQVIYAKLNNEHEKIVVECTFVFNMRPRQILKKYPTLFTSARQISGIKENVLKRFRRNPINVES